MARHSPSPGVATLVALNRLGSHSRHEAEPSLQPTSIQAKHPTRQSPPAKAWAPVKQGGIPTYLQEHLLGSRQVAQLCQDAAHPVGSRDAACISMVCIMQRGSQRAAVDRKDDEADAGRLLGNNRWGKVLQRSACRAGRANLGSHHLQSPGTPACQTSVQHPPPCPPVCAPGASIG